MDGDHEVLIANVEYGYSLGWSFTPLAGKRPTLEGWQKRPREKLDCRIHRVMRVCQPDGDKYFA